MIVPRAATAELLAQTIGKQAVVKKDIQTAYQDALALAKEKDIVVVCGSLYLLRQL